MGDKDFFLDPDDSMTMGDINYMRKSKRTKRTFPKTLKNKDGFSFENEVSSLEDRSNLYKGSNTNQDTTANTVFNPTPSSQSQPGATGGSAVTQTNFEPQQPQATPKPEPGFGSSQQTPKKSSQSDDSMDMFRNMAKNMRGKR